MLSALSTSCWLHFNNVRTRVFCSNNGNGSPVLRNTSIHHSTGTTIRIYHCCVHSACIGSYCHFKIAVSFAFQFREQGQPLFTEIFWSHYELRSMTNLHIHNVFTVSGEAEAKKLILMTLPTWIVQYKQLHPQNCWTLTTSLLILVWIVQFPADPGALQ